MITRSKLSPTGPEVSQLVYGTWRLLDDQPSPQDINRRLHRCVELGITTIDTAEIYGLYQVEAALGRALALSPGLRERLELVTKAGIYIPHAGSPERRVASYDATAAQLTRSVENSLRLLGTDHVDLFLVHRPDWLTGIEDTAGGLNQLLRKGKIGRAGVSNYSASQFAALNSRLTQPLVANQVEFHLLHMDPIFDGTLDQCQQLQVQAMAWSPLAGGRLFAKDNAAAARLAEAAAGMAARYHGATLEQLAYAWILAHPSRPIPIIGTNKIERIESAVRAAGLRLSREDWYALWVAAKGHGIP
jgi:predicted oxidoreductase